MTGPNNNKAASPSKALLYGGTGQAKLIRPILEFMGHQVAIIVDDTPGLPPPFPDVPVVEGFDNYLKAGVPVSGFVVTIGNPHAQARLAIAQKLVRSGLKALTPIHPSAVIETRHAIGEGSQILARTYVAVEAKIGEHCILNAGSQVDHESILEEGVELGPGAIVCGDCRIGAGTWIAAGAVVRDHVRIGKNVIIGAGAVVTNDIEDGLVCVGVPAKPIERKL